MVGTETSDCTDPYVSSNLPRNLKRQFSSNYKCKKHPASLMAPDKVIKLFDVTYLKKKVSIKFDGFKKETMENVLQLLLDFADQKCIQSDTISTLLLSKKHIALGELINNVSCKLNLKECHTEELDTVSTLPRDLGDFHPTKVARKYMYDVLKIYRVTVCKHSMPMGTPAHEIIKHSFSSLALCCGLTSSNFRHNGYCRLEITRRLYSSIPRRETGVKTVVSLPDFVFGPEAGSNLCIPVQVYGSSLYKEQYPASKRRKLCRESVKSSTSSAALSSPVSSSVGEYNLKETLEDAIPDLMDISEQLAEVKSDFQQQLCGQHVMALLGIAKEYQIIDNVQKNDEKYTIIGMFVLNEYVFFSKLQVGPYYLQCTEVNPSAVNQILWEKSKPVVQFFPTGLDITIQSHRTAMIAFLCQYYHEIINI